MNDAGELLFLVIPIPALTAVGVGLWALARDGRAIETGSRDKRAIGIAAWTMFAATIFYLAAYWYAVEWQFDDYSLNLDMRCPANRSHLWWHAFPWFAFVIAGWSWLTVVFVLRVEGTDRSRRQIKATVWIVGALTFLPFIYTFGALTMMHFGDGPPHVNFCPDGPNGLGE